MATPINYAHRHDVSHNDDSKDKIAKGRGEDQSRRLSLIKLKFICLTTKYHKGKLISHHTKQECHEM